MDWACGYGDSLWFIGSVPAVYGLGVPLLFKHFSLGTLFANKDTRIVFARQIKRVGKSNGRKTAQIIYANTPWCPGTRKIGWALQVNHRIRRQGSKRRNEADRKADSP
jgi:hypothetical protein